MKKLISLLLVLTMVLSLGVAAFAADGDEPLGLLRVVRQYVREVEHPQPRVLARYVEVREVVYRRRCRERIPGADAAVGGADDEPVELAAMPPYPERQHEEMPEHRERGAARPAGREDAVERLNS